MTDGSRVAPVRVGTAAGLTPREQQVAALIARGLSKRQIAAELVIAAGATANHAAHILAKLGCRNRTEVALCVRESDSLQGTQRAVPRPRSSRHRAQSLN